MYCFLNTKHRKNLFSSFPSLKCFHLTRKYNFFKIQNDDLLPKNLCIQCSKELEQSYKLRLRCLLSEKIIRVLIEKSTVKSETEEYINEINEKSDSNDIKSETDTNDDENFFEPEANNSSNFVTEETVFVKEEILDEINCNKVSLKCKFCNQKFGAKHEYISHVEQIHLKTVYSCVKCEQIYYSADGLKRHSLSHENRCRYCLELFDNKFHLAQHMKEHVEKSEFPCGKCDKVFQTKDTHRIHRKRVSTFFFHSRKFMY